MDGHKGEPGAAGSKVRNNSTATQKILPACSCGCLNPVCPYRESPVPMVLLEVPDWL